MCLLNRFAACLALPNMIVASERFEVRPIKEKQAPSYTNVAADQSRSAHFVRGGCRACLVFQGGRHVTSPETPLTRCWQSTLDGDRSVRSAARKGGAHDDQRRDLLRACTWLLRHVRHTLSVQSVSDITSARGAAEREMYHLAPCIARLQPHDRGVCVTKYVRMQETIRRRHLWKISAENP